MNNKELSMICMNHLLQRDNTSILILEELYLDFFNDYLTLEYAAENLEVDVDLFAYAIDLGRTFNHTRPTQKVTENEN